MAPMNHGHSSVEMLGDLFRDNPEFRHAVSTRTFRAGQAVAERGALNQQMLVVTKGRVQLIYESRNGRRMALATLGPGAVIWEGHLRDGRLTSMRANALTDCVVWTAAAPQAEDLLMRHATLRWGMLQTMGERMVQVENRMEEVAFQGFRERLAGLLLELSSGKDRVSAISHQALADMLGTYRETISAILRDFESGGLVELGYRRIELCDAGGLHAATGNMPSYGPAPRMQ